MITLLMGVLLIPIIAHAQSYTINLVYVGITSQSQSFSRLINITSNTLLIPVYQYCGGPDTISISAYLDPLSNLGFSSVYLILYNGSRITPTLVNYSPKYVLINIDCSLPIYGVVLTVGNYPSIPMEELLIQGDELTYQLTSGSENITIPTIPGLNYAFSIVRVITILPGSFTLKAPFTEPINETLESLTISSITANAYVVTYVTYIDTLQIISNGTTYVDITPYYALRITGNPGITVLQRQPLLAVSGAPWIHYSVNSCGTVNLSIPILTPWTSYYSYTQQCTVNYTVSPVTVRFTGLPNNVMCTNTYVLLPRGNGTLNLSSTLTLNPLVNREFHIVVSGVKYISVTLGSIPTYSVSIPLNLMTRSSIELVDENGEPVNVPLYIYMNGEFLLLSNNTCIYPGNYVVYALINNALINLGNESLVNGAVITLPYFENYELNISLPYQCPELRLQVGINYNGVNMQYPLNGNSILVNLTNVLVGTRVLVQLIGNGTTLYTTSVEVNNSSEGYVILKPRVVTFRALDLLNEEVPYATLNVGSLSFVGPGSYCIPIGSSVGFVSYGNDVYVVNLTSGEVTVRLWTISKLSVNSLLTISVLLLLILIIGIILRGFGGGGDSGDSNDYLIIRSTPPNYIT